MYCVSGRPSRTVGVVKLTQLSNTANMHACIDRCIQQERKNSVIRRARDVGAHNVQCECRGCGTNSGGGCGLVWGTRLHEKGASPRLLVISRISFDRYRPFSETAAQRLPSIAAACDVA